MQDCAPLPLSLSQLGSRHSSCLQLGLLLLWLLLWLLAWLLHHLFLLQRSCFSSWGKHWHDSWLLLRLTAELAFLFCFSGSSLCWLSWLLQTLGGALVFSPLAVFLFLTSYDDWLRCWHSMCAVQRETVRIKLSETSPNSKQAA